MSNSLYTWGGTYFGKREGDSLFTHRGVEAGRFYGDEVFGSDGCYLGELKSGKLITRLSRSSTRKSGFSPRSRMGHVGTIGRVGTVMVVGYEDFPGPGQF